MADVTTIESASAALDTIPLIAPIAMWLLLSVLLWVAIVGSLLAVERVILGLLRRRRKRAKQQGKARAAERDLQRQLARIDADTERAVQRLGAAYQHAQALIRQEAARENSKSGRDEPS